MGNSNTKESRSGDAGSRDRSSNLAPDPGGSGSGPASGSLQADRPTSRRNRASRGDLGGILGLGSAAGASGSHSHGTTHERRETKQEREARKLEKERVARIKERERSMKEEHVDGGFLVTLGTYHGPEDFNKVIVRQLQIERRLAPFWRGLNDFDTQWTEPQIIAAARGLPIPAPDQTPPEELIPRPYRPPPPAASNQNINNLTVPLGSRTQSVASEHSASGHTSNLAAGSASGTIGRAGSPFKTRGKALVAVLGGNASRNGSTTEIVPREVNLPQDPFVNGQPIEVFLYKDAIDCPICFLSYPPYLNHTRCCDQPICSECFVQIKRPDPHFPEGHNENEANHNPEEAAGLLVSEPACCPYCTQPDFGVTYDPPPFRRGLAHAASPSTLGALNTAMSSNSSLNSSTLSPPPASPATAARRRTQSLSANAPNVILTDRIRPEWATKLQAARNHQARRAAAATALHTAAFLMGNSEARSFRVSRFSRRNTGNTTNQGNPASANAPNNAEAGGENNEGSGGAGTPSQQADPEPDVNRSNPGRGPSITASAAAALGAGGGVGPSNGRRSRMEDLEDMMLMEAIRLSLASEEERKRKTEKEERKEAKRREKEERKAAKAAGRHGSGPYESPDGRSGHSSASASSLSLPGFGRKRGNSAASNLRVEASVANAVASANAANNNNNNANANNTNAGVNPNTNANANAGSAGSAGAAADPNSRDKGKGVDRGLSPLAIPKGAESTVASSSETQPSSSGTSATGTAASTPGPRPIPSPHQPVGPSHLRQMSSASSISSSLPDSQAGSYTSPSHLQDPRSSGLSLGSRSGASEDGGDHDRDRDPSASTEPMFNFRSLAEVVGVSLEGEHAGRRLSLIEAERKAKENGDEDGEAGAEEGASEHRDRVDPAAYSEHDDDAAKADEANENFRVERVEDVLASHGGGGGGLDKSVSTIRPDDGVHDSEEKNGEEAIADGSSTDVSPLMPPTVTITPDSPVHTPGTPPSHESKQLGYEMTTTVQALEAPEH